MDFTISLDSVLILFVTFFYLVISNSESKARQAIHDLRMEHRDELSQLRSENRELRSEVSQIHRELKKRRAAHRKTSQHPAIAVELVRWPDLTTPIHKTHSPSRPE